MTSDIVGTALTFARRRDAYQQLEMSEGNWVESWRKEPSRFMTKSNMSQNQGYPRSQLSQQIRSYSSNFYDKHGSLLRTDEW